jgi:hypothetical protein
LVPEGGIGIGVGVIDADIGRYLFSIAVRICVTVAPDACMRLASFATSIQT